MINQFDIKGNYYEIGNFKFRKLLEIKSKEFSKLEPDLIVIMMNPGSSEQLDKKTLEELTLAKPDTTQYQIMKVMNSCNFNFARVINLSDYREAKSKIFLEFIQKLEFQDINHSIFSPKRNDELNLLLNENATFLFAWGVNRKLIPLAKLVFNYFTKKLPEAKIVGIRKHNTEFQFYHPLPKSQKAQTKWIEEISNKINSI